MVNHVGFTDSFKEVGTEAENLEAQEAKEKVSSLFLCAYGHLLWCVCVCCVYMCRVSCVCVVHACMCERYLTNVLISSLHLSFVGTSVIMAASMQCWDSFIHFVRTVDSASAGTIPPR